MKEMRTPKIKVIAEKNPIDFQESYNEFMSSLSQRGIKGDVRFPENLGYTAYITYEEVAKIPETVEDEFALQGIRYSCVNCPCYNPSNDKRVKYFDCKYYSIPRHAESKACELLYKRVISGEWRVNE